MRKDKRKESGGKRGKEKRKESGGRWKNKKTN